MSTSSSFKIPKVLAINKNYLVLEFLESNGENCWRKFGKNLAELHSCYGLSFGLNSDNYIGTLNQKNLFYDKWCDFYINNRIIPILRFQSTYELCPENISVLEGLFIDAK